MQKLEKNNLYEFTTKPITEQLLLLVDTKTDLNETPEFKDKKENAIIGALLADVLLMKKAGLINNKVVVTTNEEAKTKYIEEFIEKLKSLEKREVMENIIHGVKSIAEDIEDNVLKKLLAEEWLVEKKGLIPFISQKELRVDSPELLKDVKATITNILTAEQEPNKELIYLMTLLYAIDMLQNFNKEGKLDREEERRMNELMEKEYIAKLIYDAIKNQPEPESLRLVDLGPPGYIAGVAGMVPKGI